MKDEERTPLRVVLRNFLNHIENLESQISPDKSYDIEFQALKLFSESVKGLKEYSCLEGEKEINRKKNRYKDILPFDVSRVVLQEYNGIPGSDYINANFIKGASGSPAYIASQGPLPCTVNDFWRMVVQCEVHVIVMACNQEEAGKAKCEKYWVDEGEERHFGRISVRLLKSSTVCPDFSVRTMRLKYSNTTSMVAEERTVCQVHYVAWPDHGVPSVVHPLLDMVRLVRDTQASETLPVLVHCSAGCGRTGTICAIDYVFGLLRTGKLTSDFSLSSLIRDMRRQRIAMVQTKEQYVLVHQAVRELFREQLSVIDSHPYENVDPDGTLLIKNDQDNIYDTIDCSTEEKGDFKMEKDTQVSSYQNRKNVTLYSSKQEKEVENLTEQLRSVQAGHKLRVLPNVSSSNIPASSSNSHHLTKTSSKHGPSSGKRDINLTNKPIPAKGILRVPLLHNTSATSQLPLSPAIMPVKRSKSLKIISAQRDRSLLGPRLTVPPDSHQLRTHPQPSQSSSTHTTVVPTPSQSKRRSSLELIGNIPDTIATIMKVNENHTADEIPTSTSLVTKKYEAINASGRKPLMRSYTTLDMRHKLTMVPSERQLYPLQSIDIRPGMNTSAEKMVSFCEHSHGGESSGVTNIRRGNNSRSYVFRNIGSSPSTSTTQPPARSYLLQDRSSKNYNILQQNAHYSGITEPPTHSIANEQTIRKHHQFADPHHHQHQTTSNLHHSLIQKGYPPSTHLFYKEKSKIPRQTRESKDGEGHYDVADYPTDKYKCLSSEATQNHMFDNRPSIQASAGPNVPLYHPPLPPRSHLPLVPPVASRDQLLQSSNFANAPGVDIDEVAASIPNKDDSKSNLMKVALEAFQVKRGKQQPQLTSRPNENRAAKGPVRKYPPCKKKQQQYL